MLKEKISADLKEAQKNRDAARVSALRMVLSAIHNQEIDKKRPSSDEDVLAVLSSERKKHIDSIAQFEQGGRADLVEQEKQELELIKSYLPAELSAEELRVLVQAAISESGAASAADFGKVMKVAVAKAAGRADGKVLSSLVKELLNGG